MGTEGVTSMELSLFRAIELTPVTIVTILSTKNVENASIYSPKNVSFPLNLSYSASSKEKNESFKSSLIM